MDDNDSVPTFSASELSRQGSSALSHLAGGAFLLLLAFGARFRVPGLILALAGLFIGLGLLFSRSRLDKRPGLLLTTAGTLGLLAKFNIPLFTPFAMFFLGLGGMLMLGSGLIKGVKFLFDLKSLR